MLVAALLLNLVGPPVVQAGGGHGDCCHHSYSGISPPEAAVAWDREEFGRWLQSAHVSDRMRDALGFILDSQQAIAMVVTESAYTEWLSSLDPFVAAKVEQSVIRVKGSDLPIEIAVHDMEGLTAEMELQSDYVIMSTAWCGYCKMVVVVFILHALTRWVFDPALYWIELQWEKVWDWSCGHYSTTTYAYDTTTCPYRPWCQGTWQTVLSDYGTSAELLCECGAVWHHYNPL